MITRRNQENILIYAAFLKLSPVEINDKELKNKEIAELISRLTFTLIISHCRFPLICIKIPERDCIARSMGGLDFMWVSPVGPKEGDSVENWFDVSNSVRPTIGKYS